MGKQRFPLGACGLRGACRTMQAGGHMGNPALAAILTAVGDGTRHDVGMTTPGVLMVVEALKTPQAMVQGTRPQVGLRPFVSL
jgi:hypothetical protein